jgi:hypothetical protein
VNTISVFKIQTQINQLKQRKGLNWNCMLATNRTSYTTLNDHECFIYSFTRLPLVMERYCLRVLLRGNTKSE